MKKLLIVFLIVAVLVGVGAYFFLPLASKHKSDAQLQSFKDCEDTGNLVIDSKPRECHTKSGQVFIEEDNSALLVDAIVLTAPQAYQVIANPFKIEGKAIGSWYLDDKLSVKLLDSNKKVIATGFLKPQEKIDSQTNFVPFIGALNFPVPETERGTLVIERTNTEPEPTDTDLKELTIPVQFQDYLSSPTPVPQATSMYTPTPSPY